MAAAFPIQRTRNRRRPTTEPLFGRWLPDHGLRFCFRIFLGVPLVAVFVNAFHKGIGYYFHTLADPMTFERDKLTLLTAAICRCR